MGFQEDYQGWIAQGLSPAEAAAKATMFKPPSGPVHQKFSETDDYNPEAFNWGGNQRAAEAWTKDALSRAQYQGEADDWYRNAAVDAQGRLVTENAGLAGMEGMSRGEQQGSVDLARDAAMGNAPSEAAYLMQHGLNQAISQQQSQAGSARGAAALANAQGNAAANIAAAQSNAYTQAGALRANEMAQARGLYGSLSGQMRQGDQSRLGQANQMAQFNRTANDQYSLGLGQLGADRAKLEAQYWGGAADIQGQQGAAMREGQALLQRSQQGSEQLEQNRYQYETGRADRDYRENQAGWGKAAETAADYAIRRQQPSGMGGSNW